MIILNIAFIKIEQTVIIRKSRSLRTKKKFKAMLIVIHKFRFVIFLHKNVDEMQNFRMKKLIFDD